MKERARIKRTIKIEASAITSVAVEPKADRVFNELSRFRMLEIRVKETQIILFLL